MFLSCCSSNSETSGKWLHYMFGSPLCFGTKASTYCYSNDAQERTEGRTILTIHPPFQQHVKAIRQFSNSGPMACRWNAPDCVPPDFSAPLCRLYFAS